MAQAHQALWREGALLDHTSEEQAVAFVQDSLAADAALEARVALEGPDGCTLDQHMNFPPPAIQSVTPIGALCLWTLAGREQQVQYRLVRILPLLLELQERGSPLVLSAQPGTVVVTAWDHVRPRLVHLPQYEFYAAAHLHGGGWDGCLLAADDCAAGTLKVARLLLDADVKEYHDQWHSRVHWRMVTRVLCALESPKLPTRVAEMIADKAVDAAPTLQNLQQVAGTLPCLSCAEDGDDEYDAYLCKHDGDDEGYFDISEDDEDYSYEEPSSYAISKCDLALVAIAYRLLGIVEDPSTASIYGRQEALP